MSLFDFLKPSSKEPVNKPATPRHDVVTRPRPINGAAITRPIGHGGVVDVRPDDPFDMYTLVRTEENLTAVTAKIKRWTEKGYTVSVDAYFTMFEHVKGVWVIDENNQAAPARLAIHMTDKWVVTDLDYQRSMEPEPEPEPEPLFAVESVVESVPAPVVESVPAPVIRRPRPKKPAQPTLPLPEPEPVEPVEPVAEEEEFGVMPLGEYHEAIRSELPQMHTRIMEHG